MQKPFERGVALLHSFWYEEAEKGFLQIAKDDPNCAMAHWGVAMSLWHQLWNEPDAKVIARTRRSKAAEKLASKATPREKAYIAAITAFYGDSEKRDHAARAKAYSDAMKKVYVTIPTITKPRRSTRFRCSPPSHTRTRRSRTARRRPRSSKSSSRPSPIIPASRIT